MTTHGHIRLINHQLRQIKSGLALARALGRRLILPAVICGYDKAWFPLASGTSKGVFAGAPPWAVPIYNCPLDHYLEVSMLRPALTLREYSFLSNPRTPATVKNSVASTSLEIKDNEVARLKRDFASVKVLNVSNLGVVDVLGKLLQPAQRSHASESFRYVGGDWCCAPNDDKKRGMPVSARFHLFHA